MSTNGHVITLKAVETTAPNHRLRGENSNSERVRLDGNIARRKVADREFFWWDTELPGFGL